MNLPPHGWFVSSPKSKVAHAISAIPLRLSAPGSGRQAKCGLRIANPQPAVEQRRCKHCKRQLEWLGKLFEAVKSDPTASPLHKGDAAATVRNHGGKDD